MVGCDDVGDAPLLLRRHKPGSDQLQTRLVSPGGRLSQPHQGHEVIAVSSTQAESASRVPSSVAQVGVTMKYTFLDYFRSRRFFILLAIVLLISGLLTVLVG